MRSSFVFTILFVLPLLIVPVLTFLLVLVLTLTLVFVLVLTLLLELVLVMIVIMYFNMTRFNERVYSILISVHLYLSTTSFVSLLIYIS